MFGKVLVLAIPIWQHMSDFMLLTYPKGDSSKCLVLALTLFHQAYRIL